MKILHTSDWHLGQYFMMKTREKEHQQFLSWLIETVNDQKVDAVIVAGDIFDSASPASYARKLYADFVVQLQQSYCSQLVIVSGNHDSVAVLNESKSLLNALNVAVLAGLSENLNDHIIEISNSKGEKGLVCALPFLRATDVMSGEHGLSAKQKQMNLQQGIAQTYEDIYQLAKQKQTEQHQLVMATGHLTAVGCSVTESVRDIYIGTLTAFPSTLFPAFDYIALGHLHRSQMVQKNNTVRYSGSPIPLSFDESKHQKQVVIIEADGEDLSVNEYPIPCFQPLMVITGDLKQVSEQLTALVNESKDDEIWAEVKLKQAYVEIDLQSVLNEIVVDSGIEILKVSSPQVNESSQWSEQQGVTLETLTPTQLFEYRLSSEEHLSDVQQEQLTLLYKQVLADVEAQS
ncbi:exonuclease subunit SbcD [Vibrio sp. 2-Bac 85]